MIYNRISFACSLSHRKSKVMIHYLIAKKMHILIFPTVSRRNVAHNVLIDIVAAALSLKTVRLFAVTRHVTLASAPFYPSSTQFNLTKYSPSLCYNCAEGAGELKAIQINHIFAYGYFRETHQIRV